MESTIGGRLMHAWNAFRDKPEPFSGEASQGPMSYGYAASVLPHRSRQMVTNERSIVTSIQNRISVDAAAIDIRHIKIDENETFVSNVRSGLNDCLNVEANVDQEARAFRQDVVQTLLDKGVVAIVPIDLGAAPSDAGSLADVTSLRVGTITAWYPSAVRVLVYNDQTGIEEEITVSKRTVAIIENPFYSVMNSPNSTVRRLAAKLQLLDAAEQDHLSGKLDLIIQLPYTVKTEIKQQQVEKRRKDVEMQLSSSKYGIAYIDGQEKITQLNRSAKSNTLDEINSLTEMLYAQLGVTPEVMDGTADEKVMLNYYNRTLEPILAAITEALIAKFLSKTARTQGHTLKYYRDPFRLVPLGDLAEIADKFTRNEIATSNEFRGVVGWTPSKDPKANELHNSNMPRTEEPTPTVTVGTDQTITDSEKEGELQNE